MTKFRKTFSTHVKESLIRFNFETISALKFCTYFSRYSRRGNIEYLKTEND